MTVFREGAAMLVLCVETIPLSTEEAEVDEAADRLAGRWRRWHRAGKQRRETG